MKTIKSFLFIVITFGFSLGANASPITEPGQLYGALNFIDFSYIPSNSGGIRDWGPFQITSNNWSIVNVDSSAAATSFPDYVSGLALGYPNANTTLPAFRIKFDNAIAQFGVGIWDPNFAGNEIRALDINGNILETTSPDQLFATGGVGADYVGFSRASADIKQIDIVANGSDLIWIDNMSYGFDASVPEPSTVLILASGLLGIGLRRRKTMSSN